MIKRHAIPPRTDTPHEVVRYRQKVCELLNKAYTNRANDISSVIIGTYPITDDDFFLPCDGTFTVTLPTAVGRAGFHYIIKNIGTGTITVDGDGSETIENLTSIYLAQYDSAQVLSDGAEWWVI